MIVKICIIVLSILLATLIVFQFFKGHYLAIPLLAILFYFPINYLIIRFSPSSEFIFEHM